MTVNTRVNPKKLRPYDVPPKRRRTLIPSAPDSSAIGFIVVAALWLALSGALGLLALGLQVHPVRILVRPRHLQPGLPDRLETGRLRLRERRGLRMALERRVRRDLLHGAAPDRPAPGAGAVRLPRAAGVELGAPGRHRLALLPRPRPACPADRHELDLRRRAGGRRVDRRAVARPDVAQLVDELLRQPLVRGHRDPLAARPADGQRRDRRGRLAHRPRRCGRGARIGLRAARDHDPVAAGDGVRGPPLRRPARRPPAARVARRRDPDVPHLARAGARIRAGRPRRRQRAVHHHVARRDRDDRPPRARRSGVREPGDHDLGALVRAVRHRRRCAGRRLTRVPARDEPARGDRRAQRRQPLPRPDRLGDRGVHLVHVRRVHVRRVRAGRSCRAEDAQARVGRGDGVGRAAVADLRRCHDRRAAAHGQRAGRGIAAR